MEDDVKQKTVAAEREATRRGREGELYHLYDADPDCRHEIVRLWSGVKCRKCSGWFCR
jgi:hypothetical protein